MAVTVSERREREIFDQKKRILNATRETISVDGLLNLKLFTIADKCEHSVGKIYQYFTSKEDVLLAIVVENGLHKIGLFQRILSWNVPSRDRILGLAIADMLYAERFPEHISLEQYVQTEMIWNLASKERRQLAIVNGKALRSIASTIAQQAVNNGELENHYLHGFETIPPIFILAKGARSLSHLNGIAETCDLKNSCRHILIHQQVLLNGFNWMPLANPSDLESLDAKISIVETEIFEGY